MAVTLLIEDASLTTESLAEFTREICRTLSKETDVQARPVQQAAPSNTKAGGVIDVPGLINIVNHLQHNPVIVGAVLPALMQFFDRRPSLSIKVSRGEGDKTKELRITAESVRHHWQQTEQALADILRG